MFPIFQKYITISSLNFGLFSFVEMYPVISPTEFNQLIPRINWKNLTGKKVLITGATGMVGSWLTTALAFGIKEGILKDTEIDAMSYSGNVTNLLALRSEKRLRIVSKHDVESSRNLDYGLVVHAASPASPQNFRNQEILRDINTSFLRKILDCSIIIPELIYFSTGEVYGAGHTKPVTETDSGYIDHSLERSMYPLAKIETEKFILDRSMEGNLRFNIYRLFHTFGPGMKIGDGRSFADFIWDGALFKKPKLYSSGSQIRTFLYLEDMVAAVFGIPLENTTFNLGSSIPVSIREFAEMVSNEASLKGELTFETEKLSYQFSPNDLLVPNISKITDKGWHQETSLRDGIARSINWARKLI